MAKKKITPGMLGGRKKKSVKEIEDAVSKIHEIEESNSKKEPAVVSDKAVAVPKMEEKKTLSPKIKKPVAKPVRFSFNMTKDLHLKFKIHCLEKDSTMQDEILMMIQKVVSKKS